MDGTQGRPLARYSRAYSGTPTPRAAKPAPTPRRSAAHECRELERAGRHGGFQAQASSRRLHEPLNPEDNRLQANQGQGNSSEGGAPSAPPANSEKSQPA